MNVCSRKGADRGAPYPASMTPAPNIANGVIIERLYPVRKP